MSDPLDCSFCGQKHSVEPCPTWETTDKSLETRARERAEMVRNSPHLEFSVSKIRLAEDVLGLIALLRSRDERAVRIVEDVADESCMARGAIVLWEALLDMVEEVRSDTWAPPDGPSCQRERAIGWKAACDEIKRRLEAAEGEGE